MKTAIYPGSFDPITLGHLNIIRRAAETFDQVVVAIMVNSGKKRPLFTLEERRNMAIRVLRELPNVTVTCADGLLADFARQYEGAVIVKGLRALTDYEYEVQMALTNKKLNPTLDTYFLAASEKFTYLSSSIVKELAYYGANLSEFLPEEIIDEVSAKVKEEDKAHE